MFHVAAQTFAGGRRHGLASAWAPDGECGRLHSAQARRSRLSDLAWVKTWTEAKIVDPIGVEIVGIGRAFWRGIIVEVLNPKTDAIFSPSARNY